MTDLFFMPKDEKDLVQDRDFKQMMENLQVMVSVYNKNGIVYVNPVAEKVLGYSLEEMKKMLTCPPKTDPVFMLG
jgi:PAS domain-containing protein